jgi:hypothetical protein
VLLFECGSCQHSTFPADQALHAGASRYPIMLQLYLYA